MADKYDEIQSKVDELESNADALKKRVQKLENMVAFVKAVAAFFGVTGVILAGFVFQAFTTAQDARRIAEASINTLRFEETRITNRFSQEETRITNGFSQVENEIIKTLTDTTAGLVEHYFVEHMAEVGLNDMTFIIGMVDKDGNRVAGKGFSAQRLSKGEYRIRFDEPFRERPIIVATTEGELYAGVIGSVVASNSRWERSSIDVKLQGRAGGFDQQWSFVAIGATSE